MKPNLSNVVVFILIEQNGSYVIQQNNIKMLKIHYFLIKRRKLIGRPNTNSANITTEIYPNNLASYTHWHIPKQLFRFISNVHI